MNNEDEPKIFASPQEALAEGWPVATNIVADLGSLSKSETVLSYDAGCPVEVPVKPQGWGSAVAAIVVDDMVCNTVENNIELDTVPIPATGFVQPLEEDETVVEVAGAEEDPVAKLARIKAEVQNWQAAVETKDSAVTDERNWRDKVTKSCFDKPKKGTQRYPLPEGFKVKLVQPFNYKLIVNENNLGDDEEVKPLNLQVEELEERIAAIGPIAADRLKSLIKWKPELSGSVYEKLDPKDDTDLAIRNLLADHLEISLGAPQLELEAPKKAKK